MSVDRLAEPLLTQEVENGLGMTKPTRKNRVVRRYTSAFVHVFPRDVFTTLVRGGPGGGAGARTTHATRGSGPGGAGQCCTGLLSVTPNSPYAGTVGAAGVAVAAGSGNANGPDGSDNTLRGANVEIALIGGKGGQASGTAGDVAGPATYVSLLGLLMVQGAAGGNAQIGDVGLPGNSPVMLDGDPDLSIRGGLGGNTGGGGGGGASLWSRGGNGGNSGVVAGATPSFSAGGGGGGADPSTAGQYAGADGGPGFWEFEYWTDEEDDG